MGHWEDDDPVHLSSEGHRDLAWVIRERAHAEQACEGVSVASSNISGNKRRAPESVVTKPPDLPSKRGRGSKPPRVAGWLVGRLDPGGDRRGGGSGVSKHAGCFPHHGGGHWGHRPPGMAAVYSRTRPEVELVVCRMCVYYSFFYLPSDGIFTNNQRFFYLFFSHEVFLFQRIKIRKKRESFLPQLNRATLSAPKSICTQL